MTPEPITWPVKLVDADDGTELEITIHPTMQVWLSVRSMESETIGLGPAQAREAAAAILQAADQVEAAAKMTAAPIDTDNA